jgi:hypothetical protein
MVQTRQQARLRAPPDNKKTYGNARVQKSRRTPTGKTIGPQGKSELTSEILRLLDKDAPEEDFKKLLAGNKAKLDFTPPLMFDNIFVKDAFYHAVEKQRLDVLLLMLERQELENWNVLHLAVLYDSLEMVKKLENEIPKLGCVVDQSGRTPLHLAFTKCNAPVAQFLLEKGCWKNYDGADRDCLGHLAVEAIAFDWKKSGMCEWARLVAWLYEQGGMVIGTRDWKGDTAIYLAQEWNIHDVRVKSVLMGWK